MNGLAVFSERNDEPKKLAARTGIANVFCQAETISRNHCIYKDFNGLRCNPSSGDATY
jgi:hypothetical protein